MPLDFPPSPTNGQVYENWVYSTSKGAWQAKPMVSAKTVTSDVPPSSPANGDQWFNTIDSTLYIYYTDVDGSQWVESRAPIISDGYYSPNAIINGAFDFWQRGTSFSNPASGAYTADRWVVQHNGTGATRTISQQTFTPGTAPVSGYEGQYFFRYAISVAGSGNTNNLLISKIEDVRTFAGETVTYSFWAKADAARTVSFDIERGYGAGGSGQENLTFTGNSVSLTTSWARYSLIVPFPSVSGKTINAGSYIGLRWSLPTGTTQTIDIWGVQVEEGSVATPFRRNANSIQGELAACQRYFIASPTTNITYGMSGNVTSGAGYVAYATFPVPMRTAPTTVTLTNGSIGSAFPSTPAAAQGITVYGFYEVRVANVTTNGYFGGNYIANAEL